MISDVYFNLITDIEIFKKSFIEFSKKEIEYRPERKIISIDQILRDIVDTAILIAKNDAAKSPEEITKFSEIRSGINQFRHFVYVGKFGILEAQVSSAKAAYLSAIILSKYKGELKKFSPSISKAEYMIVHPEYNFLNKRLKFIADGEALYYWFQTIDLLFPEIK